MPWMGGVSRDGPRSFWARPGARRSAEDFEVAATAPFIVSDDVDAAIDALRPFYALYFGGMGAKNMNFHANVPIRMGYEREVSEIQDLYLSGQKRAAEARVPGSLLEALSLIGPEGYVKDRIAAFKAAGVTMLDIQPIGPNPLQDVARIKELISA